MRRVLLVSAGGRVTAGTRRQKRARAARRAAGQVERGGLGLHDLGEIGLGDRPGRADPAEIAVAWLSAARGRGPARAPCRRWPLAAVDQGRHGQDLVPAIEGGVDHDRPAAGRAGRSARCRRRIASAMVSPGRTPRRTRVRVGSAAGLVDRGGELGAWHAARDEEKEAAPGSRRSRASGLRGGLGMRAELTRVPHDGAQVLVRRRNHGRAFGDGPLRHEDRRQQHDEGARHGHAQNRTLALPRIWASGTGP